MNEEKLLRYQINRATENIIDTYNNEEIPFTRKEITDTLNKLNRELIQNQQLRRQVQYERDTLKNRNNKMEKYYNTLQNEINVLQTKNGKQKKKTKKEG